MKAILPVSLDLPNPTLPKNNRAALDRRTGRRDGSPLLRRSTAVVFRRSPPPRVRPAPMERGYPEASSEARDMECGPALARAEAGRIPIFRAGQAAALAQIPDHLWATEVISFHQHFPPPDPIIRAGGELNFYLDATYTQLFPSYGLDRSLAPKHCARRLTASATPFPPPAG